MKKILIALGFMLAFILPVKADVMPFYINNINPESIGVYQAENEVRIYKEPNEKSKLLFDIFWDTTGFNSLSMSPSNLFVAFIPKNNLGFIPIIDENDNEDWMKIALNVNGIKYGWIKKNDDFRFMNWRTFFGLYGRKYGLYYFKDAPYDAKNVYGSSDENGKMIARISIPQNLKVTGLSGNWALIICLDYDKSQKIGWVKWRNINGDIYMFPNLLKYSAK